MHRVTVRTASGACARIAWPMSRRQLHTGANARSTRGRGAAIVAHGARDVSTLRPKQGARLAAMEPMASRAGNARMLLRRPADHVVAARAEGGLALRPQQRSLLVVGVVAAGAFDTLLFSLAPAGGRQASSPGYRRTAQRAWPYPGLGPPAEPEHGRSYRMVIGQVVAQVRAAGEAGDDAGRHVRLARTDPGLGVTTHARPRRDAQIAAARPPNLEVGRLEIVRTGGGLVRRVAQVARAIRELGRMLRPCRCDHDQQHRSDGEREPRH